MLAFLWMVLKLLFILGLWTIVLLAALRILRPRVLVQGVKLKEVIRVRSSIGWMFMDVGKVFGFVPPVWQLVRALFKQHVLKGSPVCSGKFKVKNIGSVPVDVKCYSVVGDEHIQVGLLEGLEPGKQGVMEVSRVAYPLVFGVEDSSEV